MIAAGKEDLGLSLSLTSFCGNPRGLSLKPNSISPPSHGHQKLPWFNAFSPFDHQSTGSCHGSSPLFLGRIDVNRPPHTAGPDDDEEEEAGASSPNSTISSVSGKRSERELDPASAVDEHETERASSRGISDEEDGDNSRKKLRLSKDQSAVLEESFREHNTLNPKQKLALAKRLGLRPRQVEVWFQNRRARTKLKQTEIDCEFLKRCCENLTEENRRLQKEVQELRALRLPPQFFVPPMAPPTTLTMCPSCERIAVPPATSSRPGNSSSMAVKPWARSPALINHSVLRPRS